MRCAVARLLKETRLDQSCIEGREQETVAIPDVVRLEGDVFVKVDPRQEVERRSVFRLVERDGHARLRDHGARVSGKCRHPGHRAHKQAPIGLSTADRREAQPGDKTDRNSEQVIDAHTNLYHIAQCGTVTTGDFSSARDSSQHLSVDQRAASSDHLSVERLRDVIPQRYVDEKRRP